MKCVHHWVLAEQLSYEGDCPAKCRKCHKEKMMPYVNPDYSRYDYALKDTVTPTADRLGGGFQI